jgi:hypothetical protein
MTGEVRQEREDLRENLPIVSGPITLFGTPSAERTQETGLAESSLRRAADAFHTIKAVLADGPSPILEKIGL